MFNRLFDTGKFPVQEYRFSSKFYSYFATVPTLLSQCLTPNSLDYPYLKNQQSGGS